jgi:nucleotide-binding universal stress UspA family protein
MFSNALVGVNGEEGGRDAIALAKTLVADGGELTFGYIVHAWPHGPRGWPDPSTPDERARAPEILERARLQAGLEASILWHGASSVGRGLHELAEMIEADLLVVGSTRRGLYGRARMTDDTRAALNGAPCAVAVAPAGYGSDPPPLMREIGVAYDGSPESERALGVARALAAERGSKLSAFEAVSIPADLHRAVRAHAGSSSDMVRRARERIATMEDVEPHAAYGDPVEELTLYSASLDLLVVGSRGYGPLGRLIYGSTAQHLAGTARCPLLVLKRGVRAPSAAPVDAACADTATPAFAPVGPTYPAARRAKSVGSAPHGT